MQGGDAHEAYPTPLRIDELQLENIFSAGSIATVVTWIAMGPVGQRPSHHPSRRRFAAQSNSGIRPHDHRHGASFGGDHADLSDSSDQD